MTVIFRDAGVIFTNISSSLATLGTSFASLSTAASNATAGWQYLGTTTTATTVQYVTVPAVGVTLIACSLSPGGNPGYDCPVTMMPAVQYAHPAAPVSEARQRADQARAAARSLARQRAMELLMSLLTARQAHSYVRDGWFEVRGSAGGLFRIRRRGQQGNVVEIIGGRPVASFCCHPPGGLPDADAHAAQLLHLVTDEDGFRQTANRTELHQAA